MSNERLSRSNLHSEASHFQWVSRPVAVLAYAYPVALLGVILIFRFVGERWWLSEVALYLPRILFAAPLPLLALALWLCGRTRLLLWTQLASALLLLFPLMGFCVPAPRATNLDAKTVRFLTLNANSMFAGVDAILATIERYRPDVVVMQEVADVNPPGLGALKNRFANVNWTGQFIVATRFPILEITDPERLPYFGQQRSPRYMRYLLDTPLGPLVVYNVHPLSPRGEFYTVRGGGLRHEILSGRLFEGASSSAILANSGLRVVQVEDIATHAAAETRPVVIGGDTNLPGLTHVLAELVQGYTDGFGAAGWGFGYTFPSDRPWMRIDRVLAGPALKFVGAQVGCAGISDHLCVVADIQRL